METKKTFYYHKNCSDGFGAATAAYWHHPKSNFIALGHGDKVELVDEDSILYFLDIAPKKQVIDELRASGRRCIIIDHHKTALEEHGNEHPDNHFDMSHSGAVLTWNFFKSSIEEEVPQLLQYIEDKDLWRFQLPYSKEINAVVYKTPKDFLCFLDLQNRLVVSYSSFERVVQEGRDILNAERYYIDSAKKYGVIGSFAGYENVIVINALPYVVSELLNEYANKYDCFFAVAWYHSEDGKFKYSLRSKDNGPDVGLIAKMIADELKCVGGGHKNAAGFVSETLVLPKNTRKL